MYNFHLRDNSFRSTYLNYTETQLLSKFKINSYIQYNKMILNANVPTHRINIRELDTRYFKIL